jgi:hypothetical protein
MMHSQLDFDPLAPVQAAMKSRWTSSGYRYRGFMGD